MLNINNLNLALKSLIIILPLLSSIIIFLFLLNVSIWIYDDTKVKQSIRKSKIVLFYGLAFLLFLAIIVFIVQSTIS